MVYKTKIVIRNPQIQPLIPIFLQNCYTPHAATKTGIACRSCGNGLLVDQFILIGLLFPHLDRIQNLRIYLDRFTYVRKSNLYSFRFCFFCFIAHLDPEECRFGMYCSYWIVINVIALDVTHLNQSISI